MAGSQHDDDDSVLDPAEQTMRPPDTAFNQQRIPAWNPILDPVWVIIAFFYLGLIMVPTGFKIMQLQDDVVELRETYDDYSVVDNPCGIGAIYNANKSCTIEFTAPKDMKPPILIHYEITNFHQNHRGYFNSRDDYQLAGTPGPPSSTLAEQQCAPLTKLGNITIHPCGKIANTLFNDVITLVGGNDITGQPLKMIEQGIAWQSDLQYRFAQPDGFHYAECSACNETCCEDQIKWSCKQPYRDPRTEKCYSYYYPDDNITQYLYETYPDVISPIEGVTNEHFVVWMRVATEPRFRKLYGWINQTVQAGEVMTFNIRANWVVETFQGSKALLVGTNNLFGGRNPYFGTFMYCVGFVALFSGTFFALKQTFRPRKLGDDIYLHQKED